MIKLSRVRSHPPIHENFFGAKRIAVNLKLLKQKRAGELDKKGEKKWNSAFWKEAKAQLLAETFNKCAYCESPTRIVAYGDVEHFRPKSIYWWLAYSYDNYLASCGACNQEYKKDFFELQDNSRRLSGAQILSTMTDDDLDKIAPYLTVDPVDDSSGKKLKNFEKELKKEKALLINPYFEDPERYLAYKPIPETEEVLIVPRQPKFSPIIKACEDLFGLNRKELLDQRYLWYTVYVTIRGAAESNDVPAAIKIKSRTKIEELKAPKSPYAGMIRYFETKDLSELL